MFVDVLCVALGPELECSVGVHELTSSISYARCLLLGYVRMSSGHVYIGPIMGEVCTLVLLHYYRTQNNLW